MSGLAHRGKGSFVRSYGSRALEHWGPLWNHGVDQGHVRRTGRTQERAEPRARACPALSSAEAGWTQHGQVWAVAQIKGVERQRHRCTEAARSSRSQRIPLEADPRKTQLTSLFGYRKTTGWTGAPGMNAPAEKGTAVLPMAAHAGQCLLRFSCCPWDKSELFCLGLPGQQGHSMPGLSQHLS